MDRKGHPGCLQRFSDQKNVRLVILDHEHVLWFGARLPAQGV
jgi:hypothetical protein